MSKAPLHILAIDDEAPILDLLREYLQAHGYRISTASTAAEAKRIVTNDPPQLILSDLQLHETDGLHLIEELRVILPAVPVILLTGVLFETQAIEENLKWKISAYVSKTAPLQTLLSEIRRLISGCCLAGSAIPRYTSPHRQLINGRTPFHSPAWIRSMCPRPCR